jgi:probable addiction module antidote protein
MTDELTPAEINRLEAFALTMPTLDEYTVDEFRKDPAWAKHRIASELEEYSHTGEIQYLLPTLKNAAVAKGWVWLAQETGLSRPTLYGALNGTRRPRMDTLMKILGALGFKMLFVAVDNTQPPQLPVNRRATTKKAQKAAGV